MATEQGHFECAVKTPRRFRSYWSHKKEPRSKDRGSKIVRFGVAIFAASALLYVMRVTHKYYSEAKKKSGARAKKKIKEKPSQLAQESFEAFRPFINIFDPGVKAPDGPVHAITKESWELFARYKKGEKILIHSNRQEFHQDFHPYFDIVRNIYSEQHVYDHIEHYKTSYYTSGRKELGLLYLDIDSHQPWQTDEYRAKELLQKLFPFGYYRASNRGQNGYLKLRYNSIAEFNEIADFLELTLKRVFLHFNILCDIEVKGTITDNGKSGRLAKLPFTTKTEERMRDETDSWDHNQLRLFKNCPIVNAGRVREIVRQLEPMIDDERVASLLSHKNIMRKKKWDAGGDEESWLQSTAGPVAPNTQLTEEIDVSRNTKPKATPTNRKKTTFKAIEKDNCEGHCDGNAFIRNQQDLLPFVRDYFKQHRQFPELEDALIHLRENRLFSGCWEENERKREKRVGQILNFVSETFDPNLLRSGESPKLELSLGKFAWWVRDKFGSGITANVVQLRLFDPVTMTAPVQKVFVPSKFIETVLVVANFCVNVDPLHNKAVPTKRIKKIWRMVKGGSRWNQRFFQVVRDKLDRMGVVHIFDRQHRTGKAWRWEAGPEVPAESWKESQRKLKEKQKPELVATCEKLGTATYSIRNKRVHNTLYHQDTGFSNSLVKKPDIRPPPD